MELQQNSCDWTMALRLLFKFSRFMGKTRKQKFQKTWLSGTTTVQFDESECLHYGGKKGQNH